MCKISLGLRALSKKAAEWETPEAYARFKNSAVLHHPAVGHNSMDKQREYRKYGISPLRAWLLKQKLPRPWFSISLGISVMNVRNAYCFSFAKLVLTVTSSGNDFHCRIVYAVLQTFLSSMCCSASPHFQRLPQQPAAKEAPNLSK